MSDVSATQSESKPDENQPAQPANAEAAAKAPPNAAAKVDAASTVVSTDNAGEKPAAPEIPAEPPFAVDDLIACTARFTHKAWALFNTRKTDMAFVRETPVRATLEARSADGAEELHKILVEAGVQEISRRDRTLHFTATFENIQKVIRHKETHTLDAVKI